MTPGAQIVVENTPTVNFEDGDRRLAYFSGNEMTCIYDDHDMEFFSRT